LPAGLVAGAVLGGKYTLLDRKGIGGMAVVWSARNEATGGEVAVKVMSSGGEYADRCAERMRREAHVTAMLSHRCIVQVFDFLETPEGMLVLVLELLHGHTLAEHIAQTGGMPPCEAVPLALELLSALSYVHGMRIVHRDIKPENVFLSSDVDRHVTPKLLDFGIATAPSGAIAITMPGELLGTPRYMSPEQLGGEGVDGRSDVFAMGLLLYEMIAGRQPFGDETQYVVSAARAKRLKPLPEVPAPLWNVIVRALQVRPSERFANAEAMAAALHEAMAPSPPPVLRSRPDGVLRRVLAMAALGAGAWILISSAPAAAPLRHESSGRAKMQHARPSLVRHTSERGASAEERMAEAPRRSAPRVRVAPPPPLDFGVRPRKPTNRVAIVLEPGF
jgi:eukaryotic-like serine/threonine-protein kinase